MLFSMLYALHACCTLFGASFFPLVHDRLQHAQACMCVMCERICFAGHTCVFTWGAGQRISPAEECLQARGIHDSVALALLDCGAGKGDVAGELLCWQGLAGKGSLVDLSGRGGQHGGLTQPHGHNYMTHQGVHAIMTHVCMHDSYMRVCMVHACVRACSHGSRMRACARAWRTCARMHA